MLNQEQTQILEQAIILLFRLRNEQSIDNWERERARQFGELHRPIINLKEIDSTENINDENGGTPLSDKDFKGFLNFTEKEILKKFSVSTETRHTFAKEQTEDTNAVSKFVTQKNHTTSTPFRQAAQRLKLQKRGLSKS